MPSHRLIHESVRARVATAPQWPSYTGVSELVGTTADGRCTVYYDPSLGAPCKTNALDLLADTDRVMKFNDATFGVAGGHVDVIVFALNGATDGTGGADHMGCDFNTGQNIEVCASFGNSARVSALFEAELSECSMNNTLCGLSTGEALSRWCAMEVSNNALADFASAPQWFADGMPDFVDTVDPTDQNYDSTGCGMAFISWLMSKPGGGFTLPVIAQAMVALGDSGTFADLEAKLFNKPATMAWSDFLANVKALPNGVTSDDPFGAMGTPAPGPTPQPQPGPAPGPSPGTSALMLSILVADALLADIAKGMDANEIKADVQSILDAN